MKLKLSIVFWLASALSALAQKPAIDTAAINHWQSAGDAGLSPNGKFAYFHIKSNQPGKNYLLVRSTVDQHLEKKIPEAANGIDKIAFSKDSRHLIYQKGDTLILFHLSGGGSSAFVSAGPYLLVGNNIVFEKNGQLGTRYLIDGNGRQLAVWNNIASAFELNDHVIFTVSKKDQNNNQLINCYDSSTNQLTKVGQYRLLGDFIKNNAEDRIAFAVEQSGQQATQIYQPGKGIVFRETIPADSLQFSRLREFTRDGSGVVFEKKARLTQVKPAVKDNTPDLVVFSYLNAVLPYSPVSGNGSGIGPSIQNFQNRPYVYVMDLDDHKTQQLGHPGRDVSVVVKNFAVILEVCPDDSKWNTNVTAKNFLLNRFTGNITPITLINTAPDGRYLLIRSENGDSLQSVDMRTGNRLTLTLPFAFDKGTEGYDPLKMSTDIHLTETNWVGRGADLLLLDNYDLWQVDPSGKRPALCLTGNYGKEHHIRFNLPVTFGSNNLIYYGENRLVLNAFNLDTKENGLFTVEVGKGAGLKKLIMGPQAYDLFRVNLDQNYTNYQLPIKAAQSGAWLVNRMNSNTSGNWFFTTDFKKLIPQTDIYPERNYNWLTSELLHFTTASGQQRAGMVFKPQNFDPKKRYPVIFYYYEEKSDNLHCFIRPELSYGAINIPWFVSRGYLVVVPDIEYKYGHAMQCALESVEGVAAEVAHLPYVDSTKFGLQGHSFGGAETDYIIAHSHRFAAACSASGLIDWASASGYINPHDGIMYSEFFTYGQPRMGTTFWDRPDLYIENSPLFSLQNISTPLLMYSGINDDLPTDTRQALHCLTGLRRMGKKAWLLLYKNEDHTIGKTENKLDFTLRMTQFFDHYLKGAPAPLWMTRDQTKDMAPDSEIRTPPDGGILTAKEQRRMDSLQKRKPITITIK